MRKDGEYAILQLDREDGYHINLLPFTGICEEFNCIAIVYRLYIFMIA
jgi:hypothetical protein